MSGHWFGTLRESIPPGSQGTRFRIIAGSCLFYRVQIRTEVPGDYQDFRYPEKVNLPEYSFGMNR